MDKDELEEALSKKSDSSIMKLNSIKINKQKDQIIDELGLNKKQSAELKKKLKRNIVPAYDGMKINL